MQVFMHTLMRGDCLTERGISKIAAAAAAAGLISLIRQRLFQREQNK